MMPQRNQEKDSNSGVNLVWHLGVVDPGQKNFDFYRQISEKFQFFQAILQKNIEFCRQISENFDFFQAIKKLIFQAKKVHLQLPLAKLFYFFSKVTTFEHTSLYMIKYNISRPVHDSNDPLRPSLRPPCPKFGGRDPQPAGLTPLDIAMGKSLFQRERITKGRIEKNEDTSRKEWWKHWFEVWPCTVQK